MNQLNHKKRIDLFEEMINNDQFKEVFSLINQDSTKSKGSLGAISELVDKFIKLESERISMPLEGKNYIRLLRRLRLDYLDAIEDGVDQNWLQMLVPIAQPENEDDSEKSFEKTIFEEKEPVKTFICYAPDDKQAVAMIKTYFSTMTYGGVVQLWYDGDLLPGDKREVIINSKMREAQIIFLLVSPNFVNCFDQLSGQLAIVKARENDIDGSLRVIPIYLQDGDYEGLWFNDIEHIPKENQFKFISNFESQEKAWAQTAKEFRKLIEHYF